jgi:hypothetical protein
MITFFTIPKPFAGHTGIIQDNALASWRRAVPDCEIVVCGDEPGARAAAERVGATFVADVERNEYGTPLLHSTFLRVARSARHPILCYVNADIILLPDFAAAVAKIALRPFLMVSRRWNLDVMVPCDFASADWDERLRRRAHGEGELFLPSGIDCFVFPRESPLVEMPPFAVGRPGWDNWFIYNARKRGIPVIDATRAVTLIHQNHGYGHVRAGTGDRWEGPEAQRNRALTGGGTERLFDVRDATFVLGPQGPAPSRGAYRTLRSFETLHLTIPWLAFVGRVGFALRGIPPVSRRIAARVRALLRLPAQNA